MTVVAFASAKGSPGVTTSALAVAAVWGRPVLLAECDPAGGDLLAGYLQGRVERGAGLLEVAIAARRGLAPADVLSRALRLDDSGFLALLPGLSGATPAGALTDAWPRLADAFAALGAGEGPVDVLADCGRLAAPHRPSDVLARADRVVLVVRPTLPQVQHARAQVAALRRDPMGGTEDPALGVLVVGERPYPPSEVAAALDLPLLGALPHDPPAAAVLSGQAVRGRRFDRSPLIRAARQAADRLQQSATAAAETAV